MLGSLRFRLMLLTATVLAVALTATVLVSRIAVRHEFAQLEVGDRAQAFHGAAELLAERVQHQGGAAITDSALARLAAPLSEDLMLVSPEGRVLAATRPALKEAVIRRGPGPRVEITVAERQGGTVSARRATIIGGPSAEVRARDGSLVGFLHPFPREAPERHRPGLLAVNRWLLLGVGGAGVLALLIALALSRRILSPIEALTQAARQMERGDAAARVTVGGGDEIATLGRAFNAMADSLQRHEASRRALVADVAHELRTPLTHLRCQIEAIQDGLAAPSEPVLRALHAEIILLGRLVDDLQDLALADTGRLQLHREAMAIAPAIEAALTAVKVRADERGVRLRSTAAPDLPAASADPARLAQILRNLLDNALTHTPSGGVIDVSATTAQDGVAIAVRDDGPGIPAEHLPHVFDRFYRADPSRARATGGSGLGLAIVRQLVEGHGGRVAVESEPGRGACFTFTIPAAR